MLGLQIGNATYALLNKNNNLFYYNYLKNNIVLTVNDAVITSFCTTIISFISFYFK